MILSMLKLNWKKVILRDIQNFSEPCDNFQQTPLHEAARHGHFNVVQILVSKMTDISTQDINGKAPLDYAIEGGYYKIVNFLKARSAKQGEFSSIINKHMTLGFYIGPTKPEV